MSEDAEKEPPLDDDDLGKPTQRENAGQEPKPSFVKRRAMLPRGIGAPSPFGMTPSYMTHKPEDRRETARRNEPNGPPTVSGPSWKPGGEPRPHKTERDRSDQPERPPIPQGRDARRFAPGDLSREFQQKHRPKI